MRIDAHQHFWNYDPNRHGWINDEMASIRKNFTPTELIQELRGTGIDGTIAVQVDETEAENQFMLSLAEHHEFIKGIVAWVDLKGNDAEEQIIRLSKHNKIRGFRCIMQGKQDHEFLTNKQFIEGVKKLAKHNKAYDLLVYHDQLPSLIKFTEQLPDNDMILDHIAKPDIKNHRIKEWSEQIRILAKHPKIYCKISGMITEADFRNWTYEDIMPYMEVAIDAFGINRLCFGTDWPVCLVAGSYKEVYEVVDRFIAGFSEDEKEKIMGKNTADFYKI